MKYTFAMDHVSPTDDLGEAIMQCLLDCKAEREASDEGWGVLVRIPPGLFRTATSVDLSQEVVGRDVVIEGAGHLATSIEMDRSTKIGFNARNGREVTLRNFRVFEQTGDPVKRCCGVWQGGVSAVVENVWSSNSKIGFKISGFGGVNSNCWSEYCETNMLFSSQHFDSELGMLPTPNNTGSQRISGYYSHGGPIRIANYYQIFLADVVGSINVGDVIEGTSPAIIQEVHDNAILVTLVEGMPFKNGMAVSTSNGATATIESRKGYWLSNIQLTGCMTSNQHADAGGPVSLQVDGAENVVVSSYTTRKANGIDVQNTKQFKLIGCTNTLPTRGLTINKSSGSVAHYSSPIAPVITDSNIVETDVQQE